MVVCAVEELETRCVHADRDDGNATEAREASPAVGEARARSAFAPKLAGSQGGSGARYHEVHGFIHRPTGLPFASRPSSSQQAAVEMTLPAGAAAGFPDELPCFVCLLFHGNSGSRMIEGNACDSGHTAGSTADLGLPENETIRSGRRRTVKDDGADDATGDGF